MPLESAKDYAGAIVAAVIGLFTGIWVWISMFFTVRQDVSLAHSRIDALDRKVDESHRRLMAALEAQDVRNLERDLRIEDKLDRLIERSRD